jgi:hypothetical protein
MGRVQIGQEPRMNAHAQLCVQQGALLKLTGTPCYIERTSIPSGMQSRFVDKHSAPRARTCGCRRTP